MKSTGRDHPSGSRPQPAATRLRRGAATTPPPPRERGHWRGVGVGVDGGAAVEAAGLEPSSWDIDGYSGDIYIYIYNRWIQSICSQSMSIRMVVHLSFRDSNTYVRTET